MQTKLSMVQAAMRSADWAQAIRIAARFRDLGDQRGAILDAQMALQNPRFLTQLRKDPQACIEAGKQALIDRYGYGSAA